MPINRGARKNIMRDDWGLVENPFRISAIYSPDNPDPYEKLMYGDQYEEFYEKFFLRPLEKETNRQVIGAVWSTYEANRLGKGYGKSMLMAEEAKSINRRLGGARPADPAACEQSLRGGLLHIQEVKGYFLVSGRFAGGCEVHPFFGVRR